MTQATTAGTGSNKTARQMSSRKRRQRDVPRIAMNRGPKVRVRSEPSITTPTPHDKSPNDTIANHPNTRNDESFPVDPALLRRKSMRLLVSLVTASCAATALRCANERRAHGQRSLTLAHDYDLIPAHRASNFDWDSTSFDGNVATTLVAAAPGRFVILRCRRELVVRAPPANRAPRRHARRVPAPSADVALRSDSPSSITASWRTATGSTSSTRRPAHRPRQIWSRGGRRKSLLVPPYDSPRQKMTGTWWPRFPALYRRVQRRLVLRRRRA